MTSLEMLEENVKCGSMTRKEVNGLREGKGRVTVYTDTLKNPDPKVYESGVIVLSPGATIGKHKHTDDSEEYKLLAGKVRCNSIVLSPGDSYTTFQGGTHNLVNLAKTELAFVKFTKRK